MEKNPIYCRNPKSWRCHKIVIKWHRAEWGCHEMLGFSRIFLIILIFSNFYIFLNFHQFLNFGFLKIMQIQENFENSEKFEEITKIKKIWKISENSRKSRISWYPHSARYYLVTILWHTHSHSPLPSTFRVAAVYLRNSSCSLSNSLFIASFFRKYKR